MSLTILFRISRVIQNLISELLARKVKSITVHDVVAVKISGFKRDSENFSAENILCEK